MSLGTCWFNCCQTSQFMSINKVSTFVQVYALPKRKTVGINALLVVNHLGAAFQETSPSLWDSASSASFPKIH